MGSQLEEGKTSRKPYHGVCVCVTFDHKDDIVVSERSRWPVYAKTTNHYHRPVP